jgi:hypothetical protein
MLTRLARLATCFLTAAAAASAQPQILLPYAEQAATPWRYTTNRPPQNWASPDFDDRAWAEGQAGFGTRETPGTRVRTVWSTSDIWLRKELSLPQLPDFRIAALHIRHDEDAQVYVNGQLVFEGFGYLVRVTPYDITAELKAALRPGRNVVAVHCHQTTGGQYIDLGIELDPKERPPRRTNVQELRASRWPAEKAREWYRQLGPICGFNYLPRTAVNTTEMWQKLDEPTLDQELGWAAACGLNSARVFVQYIVYEAEPKELLARMDRFLEIASRHKISTMFILFDDCFIPEPTLGPQPDPIPGVHNSRWTASPGNRRKQPENWPALERYVQDVVGHFARDPRVIVWDLYNEAAPQSRPLVEAAFAWARKAGPTQPLTSCWQAADLWDVATFHDYGAPNPGTGSDSPAGGIGACPPIAERPALCTECIARGCGSRFDNVLPVFAEKKIGWYMWGLVKGRIQTYYPWGSKEGSPEPKPWHHDLLQPDGTPYDPAEIALIRRFPALFRGK